ncbi:MAG: hypothetical protein P1Q69_05410 [Candidatus Thorarchaeota archaeon]|nr:hypothetical protein [Candidatus Thorarchaeota archaeon]
MTEKTQPNWGFLPHLFVLLILLVLEYWIFMSHGSLLPLSGDFGALVGIPFFLGIALIILIVFSLYSILSNSPKYEKLTSISLILFMIQMVLVFIEYFLIAVSAN